MATGSHKNCACFRCETEDACYMRDWENCKPCGYTTGYMGNIRKPYGSDHYRKVKDIIRDSECFTMKQLWVFNRRELKKRYIIS
ncbi:hypothetical protein LCGC14_1215250 [marine sediment metagenome]|uniref:Uncharacterized protein n=1 Tax=marine sediment metagenome TaxID=412755 RepID=A0A0F9LGZ9_9ZZZZ